MICSNCVLQRWSNMTTGPASQCEASNDVIDELGCGLRSLAGGQWNGRGLHAFVQEADHQQLCSHNSWKWIWPGDCGLCTTSKRWSSHTHSRKSNDPWQPGPCSSMNDHSMQANSKSRGLVVTVFTMAWKLVMPKLQALVVNSGLPSQGGSLVETFRT